MTGHPLDGTFARGRLRVHRACDLGVARPAPGRPSAADLLGDEVALAGRLRRVRAEVGTERHDVAASLWLEAYAWRLLLPVIGALVAERRAPLLTLAEVRLAPGPGRPEAIAVCPRRFAVLDDDPAAGHADAVRVGSADGLAAVLRDALVQHFAPAIEALNRASGRSRRALWRTIGDRAATAFLYAGAATGGPASADRLAAAVLDGRTPLAVRPAYVTRPDADGGSLRVHERRGCCLWWRTRAAEAVCLTCPIARR